MNVEKFIENFVKIDWVESSKTFGLYPFHLCSENKAGELTIGALFLGGDILSCYRTVKDHLQNQNATKVLLAVDFPKHGDMKNDFACIFEVIGDKVQIYAIPYNESTGEVFPLISDSTHLKSILEQFKTVIA